MSEKITTIEEQWFKKGKVKKIALFYGIDSTEQAIFETDDKLIFATNNKVRQLHSLILPNSIERIDIFDESRRANWIKLCNNYGIDCGLTVAIKSKNPVTHIYNKKAGYIASIKEVKNE